MKRKSILCGLIVCLYFVICCGVVYAEEAENPFICGTDPELTWELHSGLINKKFYELNSEYNSLNSDISLFSQFVEDESIGLMPSTGNVKILVLPIEFSDERIDSGVYSGFEELFFKEYDNTKKLEELSVRGLYTKWSYGKLNITGDILPIFTAPEQFSEYQNSDKQRELITMALNSYTNIDYDNYDSDNDGYIDCLYIIHGGNSREWDTSVMSATQIIPDNVNGKRFRRLAMMSSPLRPETVFNYTGTCAHEIGHLLGFEDNYDTTQSIGVYYGCAIDWNLNDLMSGRDLYLNIYYQYLLDWIDPIILPYRDELCDIELNAVENNSTSDNKAVIFIPDTFALPFIEYYIAEYRAGVKTKNYTGNPGVVLWHCNAAINSIGQYNNRDSYLKPVYKSNSGEKFTFDNDSYRTGDEWSADTTPSSDFYNDRYTGAYMKVLSMDDKKAIIRAGYKAPDMTPAPVFTMYPAEKKYVKYGEEARWPYSYTDYDELHMGLYYNEWFTSGTVTYTAGYSPKKSYIFASNLKGDGTIQIKVKPGTARKGNKYSNGAVSDVVVVDNTRPQLTLNGDEEITVEYGKSYIELGATVTDNLDPEIQNSLTIDSSKVDTTKLGTYTVWYNAQDHAGNKAVEISRTVKVVPGESYNITLNENGGILSNRVTSYIYGQGIRLPIPERAGYIFDGWYANSEFIGSKVIAIFGTDIGDKTFYAKWTECSHRDCNEEIISAPTCTAEGQKRITCKTCKSAWTEPIEKLPHTEVTDSAVEATCETAGKTEGTHCSVCNTVITAQTIIPALGHKYTVDWLNDETNHWHKCERCENTDGLAVHIEDSGTVTKPPTLDETGEKTFRCSVCGYVMRTEEIPKLEPEHTHEYGAEWKSDAESHWHECSCGERSEQAAHSSVIDSGTEPTCETAGKTEGSHCEICGYIITPQTTITALGHKYPAEWCNDETDHWHKCERCESTDDLAAHIEDSGTVNKPPTLDETGEKTFRCSVCGYVIRREEIPKLEPEHTHEYGAEWKSDAESHWHECSCGERNEQVVHNYGEWVVVKKATVTAKGSKERACSVCGYKQMQEIPAAGGSGGGGGGGGSASTTKPDPVPAKPVEQKPEEPVKQTMPFVDVKTDDWFYEAIKYAYDNGLMNGEENNRFNPNNKLNRAMLVAILYRLEKEPNADAGSFADVAAGQWYAKAVAWASANGIVKGYEDGNFRPLANISREEFAAVLMRYAEFKKVDVSKTADLSGYKDAAKVSAWAKDNLAWANAAGLIKGDDNNNLNPQGAATRAEAATILMRLVNDALK